MISLRSQHDPEVMLELDILERVLGRQSTQLTGQGIYHATRTETEPIVGQSNQNFEDVVSLQEELTIAKSKISEMTLEMRKMRGEHVEMMEMHHELVARGSYHCHQFHRILPIKIQH